MQNHFKPKIMPFPAMMSLLVETEETQFRSNGSSSKIIFFMGDPKTKFLRLFFSAVRRPPIRQTTKNFTWHCPCPTSNVWPGAIAIKWVGPILYRRSGGRRADDEGQWRTADGEKFLLLFSNTIFLSPVFFHKKWVWVILRMAVVDIR